MPSFQLWGRPGSLLVEFYSSSTDWNHHSTSLQVSLKPLWIRVFFTISNNLPDSLTEFHLGTAYWKRLSSLKPRKWFQDIWRLSCDLCNYVFWSFLTLSKSCFVSTAVKQKQWEQSSNSHRVIRVTGVVSSSICNTDRLLGLHVNSSCTIIYMYLSRSSCRYNPRLQYLTAACARVSLVCPWYNPALLCSLTAPTTTSPVSQHCIQSDEAKTT